MKFSKLSNTKFVYSIISLIFACFLFGYVTTDTGANTSGAANKTTLSTQKSATVTVPLKVNVSSKYFVEGYPENVKVKINGPAALVQTAENTKNFQAYADLEGLKPGKHTVKLKVSGVSHELSANVQPAKVTVTISKKATATFPIQVRFDSTLIGNGYAAGIASSNYSRAKVIGSRSSINAVTNVVANVSLPEGVQHSVTQNVTLEALDENGKPLNVVIEPTTIKATVPIYAATTTKKVNIHLVASGGGDNTKNYSLSTDTKTVTVTGTKQALSRLQSLNVAVPVSGVTSNTTKTVPIDTIQNGIIAVSPSSINVQITVSGQENQNSTQSQNGNNQQSGQNNQDATSKTANNQSQPAQKQGQTGQ
ncbi:CdaR family protein [Ligilactobacillus aviarius]|uniref:CdaR family protein n=1 Tax=Ligilactobacillus aviarius TaxID=1606 RepID=UPI0025A47A09|nr:CdaR family protein [Ligilactobacillus aviarius]MDM8278420.1 CdaR family protein [Ligilactobacillus aviarius]